MRVPKFGTLLAIGVAAAIAALTLTVAPLTAQEAVIRGKISAAATGEPLGGANVVVANTHLGAITTANGTYTLTIGAVLSLGASLMGEPPRSSFASKCLCTPTPEESHAP